MLNGEGLCEPFATLDAPPSKVGLVLEGGGMRGIYTAGVLDLFLEKGIGFDGVIGVSAGAAHGCSFLSGQHGRSLRYHKKYCADPRFMSLRSLFRTGNVVGVDFCYHELPDSLDLYDHEAFLRCGAEFYTVCTNVETGQAEYCRVTDMKGQIDYVRASATLPYVSKIVEYDGKKLLDGGCSDGVPVEAFMRMGYARNVVILTRPRGYVARPAPKLLAKLFYRKYPAFARALNDNHTSYNETMQKIAQLEREGKIFVIRPAKKLRVGNLESRPERLQNAYDLGRADAEACMERLTEWLERQCNEKEL